MLGETVTEKLIKIAVNSAARHVARSRAHSTRFDNERIERERDVGSSACRGTLKDPFVYFHGVTQYLTYNILYDAVERRSTTMTTTTTGTTTSGRMVVHRVFCLLVFFCRVYVQLRVENAAGSCKCTAQCASIASAYLYICRPVRYFPPPLFISARRTTRRIHEALLSF